MIWHAPGAGTPRAIFCPSEEYHILLLLYLFKFNLLFSKSYFILWSFKKPATFIYAKTVSTTPHSCN